MFNCVWYYYYYDDYQGFDYYSVTTIYLYLLYPSYYPFGHD